MPNLPNPRAGALLLALALLALAACAPRAAAPPAPAAASPSPAPIPTLAPSPSPGGPSGPDLPGRIALSAGGNLWLWEGGRARQLTTGGDAYQPAWAPDGRQIVYVRRAQSASDLMLLDPATGEGRQLSFYEPDLPLGSLDRVYSSIWALYPAWAPDGGEIAFASQYGPPYGSPAAEYRIGLYAMPPVPGADRSMLYTDQAGHVGRLAYTPDGTAILFTLTPDPPGASMIYRYDRTTGAVDPIPGMPEQSYDPAVAPGGDLVAFAARHAGGTDIFVMPLAGGEPRQITSGGRARAPAWAPDGQSLAFLSASPTERGFDLWVIALRPGPAPGEARRISYEMGADADSGVAWVGP